MKKITLYFTELLDTLKRIEKNLATIASAVSKGHGREQPSMRTGKNFHDY